MHHQLVQRDDRDLRGGHLDAARARDPLPRGRVPPGRDQRVQPLRQDGAPLRVEVRRRRLRSTRSGSFGGRGAQTLAETHDVVEQAGDRRVRARCGGVEGGVGHAVEQRGKPAGGGFEVRNGHGVLTGAVRGTHRSSSSPKQRFEADGQPRPLPHVPHRQQHAGHERAAVHRVVPDRQRLAVRAEHHLLVRDQPGQPDRVHPDARRRPRRARRAAPGWSRPAARRAPRPRRACGEQRRGAHRGAGRRVDLARVVQLDHLDGVEEPRGLAGELHGQHRADAEVGGDEHVPGALGEPAADACRAARRRSRWCRRRRRCRGRGRTARCPARRRGG